MVGRSLASSGQRVQLLISAPHWPIDWLWGISHQLNPGCTFLLQPWPTGKSLLAFIKCHFMEMDGYYGKCAANGKTCTGAREQLEKVISICTTYNDEGMSNLKL